MSISYSSSSSVSPGSSFSTQVKLENIWKTVHYTHPILAGLIDLETGPDGVITIIQHVKLECEYIMKKLGTAINLRLLQIEKQKFYILLSAKGSHVWAQIPSNQNNEEVASSTTVETEGTMLMEEFNEDIDDSVVLDANIFRSIKWPTTIYSVVKMALENFTSEFCYSKEACVLHSPSSVINSIISITRGEILCIKVYRPWVHGAVLTSSYHFGVYVGKMITEDGKELEHGVIELTKTQSDQSVRINAVPLEGTEKGTCFVLEKTKSGRPPLLFKIVYGKRTQKERDETADRALEFYRNSRDYREKYNLLNNNCEHFVNVCAFGKPHCDQHFEAILTVLPGFLRGASPVMSQFVRFILIAIFEIIEVTSKASSIMSYLGELSALAMLLIEYVFRILWDIFRLKQSNRLTLKNVLQLMERHTFSMAPEALAGICFLLVAILCTFSGPVGAIIGISGAVVLVLLRLTIRPRIERWVEQCEAARLENFLQWHPSEVARLAMDTLEEDDDHVEILENFESKNLSGKAIRELVNRERENFFENNLANTLEFLGPDRLKRFKENLKGIFGHFDISEQLRSSISLTYNDQKVSIEILDMSKFTVGQLLDVARANWQINFAKGEWQISEVNPEDNSKSLIASYISPNSTAQEIETIPDSPTKIELVYNERSKYTLL